ncbi:MAG: hypothetical protein F6K42_29240 [Leptolyngbya sp. SIO1D8]|nr:hypothetical protein [Leptolyngbya sp. SIO1D8]
MSGAFRTDDWRSPGQTLAFTAGWYYMQGGGKTSIMMHVGKALSN